MFSEAVTAVSTAVNFSVSMAEVRVLIRESSYCRSNFTFFNLSVNGFRPRGPGFDFGRYQIF
jgi:hypothetical protein